MQCQRLLQPPPRPQDHRLVATTHNHWVEFGLPCLVFAVQGAVGFLDVNDDSATDKPATPGQSAGQPRSQAVPPKVPSGDLSATSVPNTAVEKRMSDFESSIRSLTLAQTLVAVATCIILALQLNEMHTGSKDTHDLAVAAKAQSDAAKAIAESAKSQSEATSQIASSTGEEVRQLKASVAEEHAATEHADLSLQRSERPWVNAESIDVKGLTPPDRDHPTLTMHVKTILRNTGKSVATNGWMWIYIAPNLVKTLRNDWRRPCEAIARQKAAEAQANKLNLGATWPMGFVLAPGESVAEEIAFGGSDITIHNYQSGYWVLGCTTYDDQFGNHHHTNFCFVPAGPGDTPDAPKFKACNGFQEAN